MIQGILYVINGYRNYILPAIHRINGDLLNDLSSNKGKLAREKINGAVAIQLSVDVTNVQVVLHYIYQTLLSKATYSAIHLYCQYVWSLGIKPTTFALLTQCSNHWATGTQVCYSHGMCLICTWTAMEPQLKKLPFGQITFKKKKKKKQDTALKTMQSF